MHINSRRGVSMPLVVAVIAVVIVVGGILLFRSRTATDNGSPNKGAPSLKVPAPGSEDVDEMVVVGEKVITFTDAGYSPSSLTVKAGETVTFKNVGSKPTWPASAMHPTHKVYPGSGIEKCGTSEEGKIFDACRGVAPGGSWSFTFHEVGEWKYHDHLNSGIFGTIVVQE